MPIMEVTKDETIKVVYDEQSNRFIIVADDMFIANVMGELILSGVRGPENFPLFAQFIRAINTAVNPK